MAKKVFIKSFGCQMNKLDTSLMRSALNSAGYEETKDIETSDVVLINTCSVREHAEKRVLSNLGYVKHLKKSRPGMIVAVTGCMAQRLAGELLEHEAVDIVCGPNEIPRIKDFIEKTMETKGNQLAVTEQIRRKSGENPELEDFECAYDTAAHNIPGQAFVRVMRGCNNFCTYCIVPYVRGPEVSRPPEKIIEQIHRLADEGIRQVTLLGQTVNFYEYNTCGTTYHLAELLELVSEIEGIEWIKFVTSYPTQNNYDKLLEAMRDLPKVCGYLHLPAQSGSDKILKAMNRKYSVASYLELIERAKEMVPDIALAGDFIVGFPGEGDKEFRETVSLVKKAGYRNCFVFKYSPRPGTLGAKRLEDVVPQEVKEKRNIELLVVQEEKSRELSRGFQDKTVRVLVEGLSKKPQIQAENGGFQPQLMGRTAGDWIVVFNGPKELAGEFADVKIVKTSPFTLFGELGK